MREARKDHRYQPPNRQLKRQRILHLVTRGELKILKEQRQMHGREMEGKNPRESHSMYEMMDRSVGDERGVMLGEDGHKWSGWGIKDGGWWIPCVPMS